MLILLNANERVGCLQSVERLKYKMPCIRQVSSPISDTYLRQVFNPISELLNLANYNGKGKPEKEHLENMNLATRNIKPIA